MILTIQRNTNEYSKDYHYTAMVVDDNDRVWVDDFTTKPTAAEVERIYLEYIEEGLPL